MVTRNHVTRFHVTPFGISFRIYSFFHLNFNSPSLMFSLFSFLLSYHFLFCLSLCYSLFYDFTHAQTDNSLGLPSSLPFRHLFESSLMTSRVYRVISLNTGNLCFSYVTSLNVDLTFALMTFWIRKQSVKDIP